RRLLTVDIVCLYPPAGALRYATQLGRLEAFNGLRIFQVSVSLFPSTSLCAVVELRLRVLRVVYRIYPLNI
ncbi:hypothetical protein C8R47DRAFT_1147309, partial [Mycena vitilis]